VLTPLLVTLAVVPFRDDFANTNAALILVPVIVAVAAFGSRTAGLLAALSAAGVVRPSSDQALREFAISDRSDLETAALLLAVGVGVTQLAVWGALAARTGLSGCRLPRRHPSRGRSCRHRRVVR
jgi:hypothetical protein